MTVSYFERLLEYSWWAGSRLLQRLRSIESVPPTAQRLFVHVTTTEEIYLLRMKGVDPWPQDFWPAERSLEVCEAVLRDNQAGYRTFMSELKDSDLARSARYRNSKGAPFATPIADLLTHLSLHGAYHRGQIATLLRQAGLEPVNTDFITFTREG